jgi:hypothetical protein
MTVFNVIIFHGLSSLEKMIFPSFVCSEMLITIQMNSNEPLSCRDGIPKEIEEKYNEELVRSMLAKENEEFVRSMWAKVDERERQRIAYLEKCIEKTKKGK